MGIVLKNNATTLLASAVSSTATSFDVVDGTVFPAVGGGDYFYATMVATSGNTEIVKVTGLSGNTLTVERGAESTIAIPFAANSLIDLKVTRQNIIDLVTQTVDTVIAPEVSDAMEPVVQATTLTEALVELGIREIHLDTYGPLGSAALFTAALQAAITDLAYPYGGIIIVPPGAYTINADVLITRGIKLRGSGNGSSTITESNSGKIIVGGSGSTTSDVWIEDLLIVGENGATAPAVVFDRCSRSGIRNCIVSGIDFAAIDIGTVANPGSSTRITVEDMVIILDAANSSGVRMHGGGINVIDGINVQGTAGQGQTSIDMINTATLDGNIIRKSGGSGMDYGLRWRGSSNVVNLFAQTSGFDRCSQGAIHIQPTGTPTASDWVIDGGYFSGIGSTSGIDAPVMLFDMPVGSTLSGVKVSGLAKDGRQEAVKLTGAGTFANISFVGLVCKDNARAAAATYAAIRDATTSGVAGLIVDGCSFVSAPSTYTYGVHVGTVGTNTKLDDVYWNSFRNCATADINFGGTAYSSSGAPWGMTLSATDRLIGRDTASAGAAEELTVGGNLEFTGSGGIQRGALTGDVTASAGSGTTALAAGSASVLNSGTLPAGRMPALTGDVTTSAGAVATTIAANAVTLAKMATMATDSILGRATASTGNVEVITALPFAYTGDVTRAADSNTTVLAAGSASVLNSGTLPAGRMPALTGDITTSAGAVATTIANDAVTYAKMQNISATDKLLGRVSSGSGDTEEVTFTDQAQALADDTSFQAMCATLGTWYVLGQSSVAVAQTNNTSENTFATIVVPANAMGTNGCVRITSFWSGTNSANNKTVRHKFGATTYSAANFTTNLSWRQQTAVGNRNAANSQVGNQASGFGGGGAAPTTGAVDTTASVNILLTGQMAALAETMTLEGYLVELYYQA